MAIAADPFFAAAVRSGTAGTAEDFDHTVRDVHAAQNAGAAIVVAVTTGDVPAATLGAANPTHVLRGVAEIPGLFGLVPG